MTDENRVPYDRSLSPYELFRRMGEQNKPRHSYQEGGDHSAWKSAALPDVLRTLGRIPDPVEPNAELLVEFSDGEMIQQRWIIDVQDGISAMLLVNRPAGAQGRLPMLLCWPGHTPNSEWGKKAVMGDRSTPELDSYVQYSGLNYGRYMAETEGFVTFAIDWMGQGDRADSGKPNNRDFALGGHGHWCNLYYLNATLLGATPLGMNLAHAMRAVDFVSTLDYVDPQRLGVMGESTGGTLSLWSTLVDERIKATEIICYSDEFRAFALRDAQYCGSQITPGLFTLVDVPDLQGLIAPRPLLVDIGTYDPILRIESASRCADKVTQIYAGAGAADHFEKRIFPGPHGWRPGRSADFFRHHLAQPSTATAPRS